MQDVDPKKKAAAEFLVDQMNGLSKSLYIIYIYFRPGQISYAQ